MTPFRPFCGVLWDEARLWGIADTTSFRYVAEIGASVWHSYPQSKARIGILHLWER